ncbi:CLUMA_CG004923, isoform A [Clunio marinus]|uniref:CLUMA_CG004923, isoform A n=1 Tax=Clunio marinus TaxID=568069 RepID=A0A1J1HYP3_9DIPT|nr:CLUMA_CG004923, isoform A [Clunio marinus]
MLADMVTNKGGLRLITTRSYQINDTELPSDMIAHTWFANAHLEFKTHLRHENYESDQSFKV